MNNPSPLVPQGSLDPKNKRRARVKIAVFFVLAVHGVGLLALLLQGCRHEDATAAADKATNSTPTFDATNPPAVAEPSTPANPVPNTPAVAEAAHTPAQPAAATEYAVVKNDSFSTIAKNFHVTVAALRDANPGVEPTKLQIGQKLHIPEPTKATASAAATAPATATLAPPVAESAGGNQPYTVKSGDTLIRLAQVNHTTVKAIRAANNLKSDRIIVGQKLRIPVKSSQNANADARPSDVAAVPVASVSH